jgi:preprotein translocase subunit SecE
VSHKVNKSMADTDNPEALPPRVARFGEGSERKAARGERGSSGTGVGPFGRLAQFLRDVRAELKRVSWPTLNEVKNTTIITLIAVIFFAVYLFLVDRIWAFLLTELGNLLTKLTGG